MAKDGRPMDNVFPCLPLRQHVLSLCERLRYFMRRDRAALKLD
jgi:hypothetical protein